MAHSSAIATLMAALIILPAAAQQKYTGGPPPKKNVPFLVQAENLIETEAQKASEQTKKNDTIYTIPGDKCTSRTPLASPCWSSTPTAWTRRSCSSSASK